MIVFVPKQVFEIKAGDSILGGQYGWKIDAVRVTRSCRHGNSGRLWRLEHGHDSIVLPRYETVLVARAGA